MPIQVTQSSMPKFEEYIEEIKPIFESRCLTNMGVVYKRFQHQLIDYLGVPYLSLFVNGHMALEMAIQALDLNKAGGEVITTPFTFVSTTHAIVRNGLKPVFCDIKSDDYTIDPKKIENLITENTVAIIPVHVYGSICDVEAIEQIARKYNLKVIYDAAHAFGVTYRNIGVGNFGDATMFSFHATKCFHSIEGGAISFQDESYRRKLHCLKNFGIEGPEDVTDIGANAKLDEFRAAMGICNLRHIDECFEKREAVYKRYYERLKDRSGLKLLEIQPNVKPNYAYFPVCFDKELFGKGRDEVQIYLRKNGINTRKYFFPAVNEMQCYKEEYKEMHTPIAHKVSLEVLALPMYEDLAFEDVDRICDLILD
ncbi:DegT/DnrJ/EryC1/StrS family aminotransferase [Faecalicatena sp. AGMB00832]|uniref:DegT/DnrJ/EryC1/StrS family aminotransferase n=1 Tax=Faecalicatena faecalis TaxID=2726362 RepID=A0ABS6D623_9FIRM|nr:DegT/DnrJ/EryC1/StrS family aminotransferase [Faecalicatena faecalis]MBU3877052.1 DegT/DnrJ/EryC1/StrS family aminotransferase [Faecalicatena faecalis]